MRIHREFFVAVLERLKLPVRIAGLRSLAAVNLYENPEGNLVWWNPLACSEPCPGSKPLYPNMTGAVAQIYPTFHAGVITTVDMYSGLHWTAVRDAIRNYDRRGPILDAFRDAYTWAKIDFRHADFNTATILDARLAHRLYGPGDTP